MHARNKMDMISLPALTCIGSPDQRVRPSNIKPFKSPPRCVGDRCYQGVWVVGSQIHMGRYHIDVPGCIYTYLGLVLWGTLVGLDPTRTGALGVIKSHILDGQSGSGGIRAVYLNRVSELIGLHCLNWAGRVQVWCAC